MSNIKPYKNEMQHLYCFMMIYKILMKRYKLSSIRILDCRVKFMQKNSRLKDVKIQLTVLENVIFIT